MSKTAWSKLTPRGRARLKASGVIPASYNAWYKRPPAKRIGIDREQFIRGKTAEQQKRSRKRNLSARRRAIVDRLVNLNSSDANRKLIDNPVRRRRIQAIVDNMDITEIEIVESLSDSGIRDRARKEAYIYIQNKDVEIDMNPLFYH